ncbi:MAG: C39 family peptidase [Actinomycetota bacterium]|nr:C39 family peptidase [Actinomycetota bacterium]
MKGKLARFVLATTLMWSLSVGCAHAEVNMSCSDGGLLDDPELTASLDAEPAEQTLLKEASVGMTSNLTPPNATPDMASIDDSVCSLNRYGYQTRSVTNYRQEKSYYCGPATARQALGFHKAASHSVAALPCQWTLASKIGTERYRASSTAAIANALNSYKGTFGSNFTYIASDIANTRSPFETFVNRIGTQLRSISQNPTTPIVLCQTRRISRYNGVASRHYMTVSGIDDRVAPMRMRSVDPHYLSSYYGVRWENVGSTSTNGLCRAVYQADLDGTNKVMAW